MSRLSGYHRTRGWRCGVGRSRRARGVSLSGWGGSGVAQEVTKQREKLRWLFDVRDVSARLNDDARRAEGTCRCLGRRERDRVLTTVYYQCRQVHAFQRVREVVVAERLPDGLLHASGDAEGGEVARAVRIGEIAGDADLEGALAVPLGVPLAEAGYLKLGTQRRDLRARLSPGELLLERLARRPRDRRGVDEGEAHRGGGDASRCCLDRIQHREQAAPRIADDGERLDVQLGAHASEVGDLIAPPDDGAVVVVTRTAASALVVGDDAVVLGEGEHLRQQILVARGGPAMEEEQGWRVDRPPRGPVEGHWRAGGESVSAWRRDGRHRAGLWGSAPHSGSAVS